MDVEQQCRRCTTQNLFTDTFAKIFVLDVKMIKNLAL